nr:Gal [synthetic construct]
MSSNQTPDPRPEIIACAPLTTSSTVPEATRSHLITTFNPHVPFEENIGGMYLKREIVISGFPKSNASRMTINLLMNASGAIAFHLDVRFNAEGDHNVVVRNSKKEGESWGSEERTIPYFPFCPGTFFELKITAEENYFKVDVNNKHVFDYLYHFPPLAFVDVLQVTGDVILTKVAY